MIEYKNITNDIELSKKTVLKSGRTKFHKPVHLMHSTEGIEIAGSGTRHSNEKWLVRLDINEIEHSQAFRTLSEAIEMFNSIVI